MKEVRKNILVLASTFPRWKNDTTPPFVFELEKRLTKNFNITILAPHHHRAKKSEVMEGLKVKRFQYFWPARFQKLCYEGGILPNLKQNRFLYIQAVSLIFTEFIAALRIIKKGRIDLVHAHWLIPQGIVAYALKKIINTPYIITVHGGDIYGLQNPLVNTLRRVILNNAKTITVVSEAIKKEIINKYSKDLNIQVISMGVDPKLFNPNKFDPNLKKKYDIQGPLLLFVGRLAEKKGVQYLLQAMPAILKKYPQAKLLIIGEGPLEMQLKSLSAKFQIDKSVIFVGPIPYLDLPKYYATADIFIGPSIKTEEGDTEGFGLTFAEAGLSKCILIGSNIGGITDIILNDKTGFLVKEKSHQDISKKIIAVLTNPKLKEKVENKARKIMLKKFGWNLIIRKYIDIL